MIWKVENHKGIQIWYSKDVVIEQEKTINKYRNTLKDIRKMLIIADKTQNGKTHFEYMDNALSKVTEALKQNYTQSQVKYEFLSGRFNEK